MHVSWNISQGRDIPDLAMLILRRVRGAQPKSLGNGARIHSDKTGQQDSPGSRSVDFSAGHVRGGDSFLISLMALTGKHGLHFR